MRPSGNCARSTKPKLTDQAAASIPAADQKPATSRLFHYDSWHKFDLILISGTLGIMPKGPFKRTLKWKSGDLFAVPLTDGSFGVAQIVAPVESYAIDFCLLSLRTKVVPTDAPEIAYQQLVAVLATWRTVVTGGHWAKIGFREPIVSVDFCPNQQLIANNGGRGVKHSSWGLLEDFLSAYHGLFPWNLYPAFDFDSYLLEGVSRPKAAKVLDAASLLEYRKHAQAARLSS